MEMQTAKVKQKGGWRDRDHIMALGEISYTPRIVRAKRDEASARVAAKGAYTRRGETGRGRYTWVRYRSIIPVPFFRGGREITMRRKINTR